MKKLLNQFYQIFLLNIREFFRDPEILFWGFLFPILLSVILGFTFLDKEDKRKIPVGIIIENQNSYNKDILIKLQQNQNLNLVTIQKKEDISSLLIKKRIFSYVIFDTNQKIIIHYDTRSTESQLSYLEILNSLKEKRIEVSTIINRGNRYIDFLLPGLIAAGIMNSAIWGIGWSFIQLRLKKVLKIFSASPMNVDIFFIGFMFTRYLLSILENLVLFLITNAIFDIPFNGNFIDLIILYSIGYFTFSGLALIAGSRANNTYIGNAIMNTITLPMYILSGVFFSYQNLPDFLVNIVQFLPLNLLVDSFRSLFLEGSTFQDIQMNLLILFFMGCVFFVLGKKMFLWK